jgi:hypothetical protein
MASRPRGYTRWEPRPEAAVILDQVQQIIDGADEALTARQIFYMLVGRYNYDKTEQAYGRLCENLVKARRAQILDFSWIRDEKTDELGGDWGYSSTGEFWDRLRESSRRFRYPLREDQPDEIELWCEARGMGPSLNRIATQYGVPVFATGGFPGVTVTHAMAQRVLENHENGQRTIFLHLGDYDPSGEAIYEAMRDDVRAFVAGHLGGSLERADETFVPVRIGLTWEQVEEHGIETAPPKKSDGRSANWEARGNTESAQLEAVDTDLLRSWARDAIEDHTDLDLLEASRERSAAQREKINDRLEALFAEFDEDAE